MKNTNQFASALHDVLDRFDFPQEGDERLLAFSEVFDVPYQKAKLILAGTILPKRRVLEKIADEFLIELDDLLEPKAASI